MKLLILSGMLIISACFYACAVDGIAVSCHSVKTDPTDLHTGSIVMHVIRSDTVAESNVIYAADDARSVRISPDGDRIVFARARDGVMCVGGITGSYVDSISDVGPGAIIDWADLEFVYFTEIFNYFRLSRLSVWNPDDRDIVGYFDVGIVNLSIAAESDSFRAVVGLDFGGGEYTFSTINHKRFLLNRHVCCAGDISASGNLYSLGVCENNSNGYHKGFTIMSWNGDSTGYLRAPQDEYMTRGTWAVNTDDWFAATAGKDRELLLYHDMVLLAKNNSKIIRVTKNAPNAYDEACDFWEGNPDDAIASAGKKAMNAGLKADIRILPAKTEAFTYRAYSVNGRLIHSVNKNGKIKMPAGVYLINTGNNRFVKKANVGIED